LTGSLSRKAKTFPEMLALALLHTIGLSALSLASAWPTAEPYYPHYPSRPVQTLTGTWAFGAASAGVDPASVPYAAITLGSTVQVPSAIDVAPPGVLPVRGTFYYRSDHTCTPGARALIKFGAVNFYARVFVDGAVLGVHTAGPYTPFMMVAPACGAAGSRELTVVINNQPNNTLCPTFTGGDFFAYSGIIRPVIVTELPPAVAYWIDAVQPLSKDVTAGTIDVTVVLGGDVSALGGSVSLTLAFDGNSGKGQLVALTNATAVIKDIPVPNFKLWTLGQGNLFTLQVTEGASGDSVLVRSGLRVLGTASGPGGNARITINGEIVKLVGYNRHTMYPDTGAAVTIAQEKQDVALLQALNANYVRGAHYPQSQSWLDLLDEAGIALWEETIGPGVSLKNIQDPWFMQNQLTAVTSMVLTSWSHPSVILHGYFNEGPSDQQAACVGYGACADTIKALVGNPPKAFVTWANNKVSKDVCIAHEDVISFNSYPGWYDREGNVTYPLVYWPQQAAWAAQNWGGKPVTVSETGGGGVFEWLNDTAPFPGIQWSQFYQKNLVEADAKTIVGDDRFSGLTLWQFADIKADDSDTKSCGQCPYLPHPANLTQPWDCAYVDVQVCGRPKGENNKGSVDFWRRRKEIFSVVSQIYAGAK
jgi:beta-glucuronidase